MKTLTLLLVCGALLSCSAAPVIPPPEPVKPPIDLAALERECLRDPLDPKAWRRLAAGLEQDGQGARAARALRQAAMLEQNDLRADLALVERSPLPLTRLVVRADGLLELRREAPLAEAEVLLEVRNGNGVRGMARSFARSIEGGSVKVVRLSNQRGFGVQASLVEYQGDYADAAGRLAQRIGAANVVPVDSGLGAANVRVLLGRDQVKKKPPRRAAMEERSLLEISSS